MPFRDLALFILFLSGIAMAQGRKPAVEDFVGIEVEQVERTGTDTLVNLENDVQKIEIVQSAGPKQFEAGTDYSKHGNDESPWGPLSVIGLIFTIALPVLSYLMLMHHLRKKASIESASNVELLEKYRKQREQSKKLDEDNRHAS